MLLVCHIICMQYTQEWVAGQVEFVENDPVEIWRNSNHIWWYHECTEVDNWITGDQLWLKKLYKCSES